MGGSQKSVLAVAGAFAPRQLLTWLTIAPVACGAFSFSMALPASALSSPMAPSVKQPSFVIQHLPDKFHAHRVEREALATAGPPGRRRALENLISLADTKNPVAEYWLGAYYLREAKGDSRLKKWGMRWLEDSAGLGCRRAAAALYKLFPQQGRGGDLYQRYLDRAATLGWPPAECTRGIELLKGIWGAKTEGLTLLGRGAKQRYFPALKILYELAKDPKMPLAFRQRAAHGILRAAESGWPLAGQDAGEIYLAGQPMGRHLHLAFHYFSMAAAKLRLSQRSCGVMLLYGWGTAPNPNLGIRYLVAAYRAGSGRAALALAGYFQNIQWNYVKAVFWYRKAAEQRNAIAEYNLGVLYYFGRGVPQNFPKALYWLKLAAAAGSKRAVQAIAVIKGGH